jgi:hypothetical protein
MLDKFKTQPEGIEIVIEAETEDVIMKVQNLS